MYILYIMQKYIKEEELRKICVLLKIERFWKEEYILKMAKMFSITCPEAMAQFIQDKEISPSAVFQSAVQNLIETSKISNGGFGKWFLIF